MLKQVVKDCIRAAGFEVRRLPSGTSASRLRVDPGFRHFHIGCGTILAPGYLNIDGDLSSAGMPREVRHPTASRRDPRAFALSHDFRFGIPAHDGTLEAIYHSHFLEHLTQAEGIAFLVECARCLRKGGRMRLAVPDLALWSSGLAEGGSPLFDWYRKTYLNDDRDLYPTDGSVFAGMLYGWQHRTAYDYETVAARLSGAGFTNIAKMPWGVSEALPSIEVLEPADSNRRPESLVVECERA